MSQSINVNVTPGYFPPAINVSQYDVGRTFVLNLVDSSGAYNIPSGATVKLEGTKPSGFGFSLTGSVSNNAVTFVTTSTVTAEAGVVPCEVSITSSGTVIGTANLNLYVEESPHPDGTIDGDAAAVVPILTELVERIEAAADSIHDLTVEATTLSYDADATATYDSELNKITFGIPRGGALTVSDPDSDGNIVMLFQ